jgi:hypothetical protein
MTKRRSLKTGCGHTVTRSPYEYTSKKNGHSSSRRSVQSDALTLHQLTLCRSTALDPRKKCTPLRKRGLSVCKERCNGWGVVVDARSTFGLIQNQEKISFPLIIANIRLYLEICCVHGIIPLPEHRSSKLRLVVFLSSGQASLEVLVCRWRMSRSVTADL